jgi:hypothetical protein
LVPEEGVEPSRLTAPDPKSGASTNSATRALTLINFIHMLQIDSRQDRKMFCATERFHSNTLSSL